MVFGYIGSLKNHILLLLSFFLLSMLLGWLSGPTEGLAPLQPIFEWILGLPPHYAVLIIWINNLKTAGIAFLLGIGFGLLPIFVMVENGFFVGIAIRSSLDAGMSHECLALGLLPHGILELLMILLACSAGLRLGIQSLRAIRGLQSDIKGEFLSGAKIFVYIVIPLLLLAASIEIYITKPLLIPCKI
jgi:stage II sporulation protein M